MDLGTPQVSVVIPAYNRSHLLGPAIASALAQDGVDVEVVVVDDGSTDDTAGAVVREFGADARVRLIRQANGGPARARNTGVRNARAPLIAFLDSDDTWLPTKLGAQLALMTADPGLGLVFTGYETRDAGLGSVLHVYVPSPTQRGDAFEAILRCCFIKTSTALVRRHVLDEVGLFTEELFGPEDWELFARILARYRVECVPDPCVTYRSHPGSIQTDLERWAANDHKAMDLIFALPRAARYHHLLRQQRHRIHSEAGCRHFYRGDHRAARRHFLRSLAYGVDVQCLSYLAKTLLPAGMLARRRARQAGAPGAPGT